MQTALQATRAQMGETVREAFRDLLVTVLSDRLFHAEVLASGSFSWRRAFTKEFGAHYEGNRIFCDQLADTAFHLFQASWRDRYLTESSPAYDGLSPAQLLDRVEMKSPPTEQEIEDAWELEIGSSEDAMRQMYEGSARVRKGRDLGAITVKPS